MKVIRVAALPLNMDRLFITLYVFSKDLKCCVHHKQNPLHVCYQEWIFKIRQHQTLLIPQQGSSQKKKKKL